jgi:hypothetical protein
MRIYEDRCGVLSLYPHVTYDHVLKLRLNRCPTASIRKDFDRHSLQDTTFASLRVIDPNFVPRRVLIIGMGTGNFVYGAAVWDELEELTVVELSQAVIDATLEYSDPRLVDLLVDDPRVHLIRGDGRRYLQAALKAGKTFDVIQIGTFNPRTSGSGNLYSRDFFQIASEALSDNGYLITLSYTGVIKTATDVFRSVFTVNDFARMGIVLCTDATVKPQKAATVPSRVASVLHASKVSQIGKHSFPKEFEIPFYHLKPGSVDDFPVNTDDYPIFEYRTVRLLERGPNPFQRVRVGDLDEFYEVSTVEVKVSDRQEGAGRGE